MKRLSISVDMGAKNNGVFICKDDGLKIIQKEAFNVIINEGKINFSKKSRRENRHKDRNYKRRKLAKRLFEELFSLNNYNKKQRELLFGLLNNRGYTFLSSESKFETLSEITIKFNNHYIKELEKYQIKEKFEEFFQSNFDNDKELIKFLKDCMSAIDKKINELSNFINKSKIVYDLEALKNKEIKKFKSYSYIKKLLFKNGYNNLGKNEKDVTNNIIQNNLDLSKIDFEEEIKNIKSLNFENEFCEKENKNTIDEDLEALKVFFIGTLKEIETGSKPRKQYLKEIKNEIENLNFIENKDKFFNLIGNISNLQLRVLRKFFNIKSSHKDRFHILKTYFVSHHYEKEDEKIRRKELFKEINKHNDLVEFLQNCNPELTIPPYEDMNNRDTYKCNSMLIKPELITDELKETIDFLLNKDELKRLKINEQGELKKEELKKTKIVKNNQKIEEDFTYSKYLQRILDSTIDFTTPELNPRNVFKHEAKFEKGRISSIDCFKREFTQKHYDRLKPIAIAYYKEEEKIKNGIYEEDTSILIKCNTNTPYKNNAKHILLKAIYSYNFTPDEANILLKKIENTKWLQTALERISKQAKIYQNSFYYILQRAFEDEKFSQDKEIEEIINTISKNFDELKNILENTLDITTSNISKIDKIDEKNLNKILNIFKQTYEILFKEISGFNKTCRCCTIENSIRSDETQAIAIRLLSDVAKPIDGMLDMMLDRLAYEITKDINEDDIKDINILEIALEQNKFDFEESLNAIKRANNNQIKKYKNDYKDLLNIDICPYTGENFEKGDWDHILPQSKTLYNSKANMIYCSTKGNQEIKGAKYWNFEQLNEKHLEKIFNTKDKQSIKNQIKQSLESIKTEEFTNFDNLKLEQQKAFRYALFMDEDTQEFKKAFELLKKDKIKTFSNGTQKRLARLIYEKLAKKFATHFKNNKIEVNSKIIDNKLVSYTRKFLATNQTTGEINNDIFKQDRQNAHSHCVDAMVVFYLANSQIKGQKHTQKENINTLTPNFAFDTIYLESSQINLLEKSKTFISSKTEELGSYKLFADTIYSENYRHITKSSLKEKELNILIEYNVLYQNRNNKKQFITNLDQIEENCTYKIDIQKISNLIHKFFIQKDTNSLFQLKFIDKLRYCTSRKEVIEIFFSKDKLIDFNDIKSIPPYSQNLYKAVYKKLQNDKNIFNDNDGKTTLNTNYLNQLLENIFESKQKNENRLKQKRGRKRHKFTLPILGSPKFRIKREDTWQILGNADIATKNYIINGEIKPIAFFTKNTIPLEISDLLDCLLLSKNMQNIYNVDINIEEIKEYVSSLKYLITEKSRCTVVVTLKKYSFKDINFNAIKEYNMAKDEEFKKLIENYLENKNSSLYKYLGSNRYMPKEAKADIIDINKQTITLKYSANINGDKKNIIIKNLDETHNSQ